MADDAGALMVRSGLVSSAALDDARARVAASGGTLGEQLVTSGAIADDDLTDFYRSRLLVPQVNPNTLARLPIKVVAAIPSDMAIELRAIPVSFDGDNNLTVAMSDPSDRHAVDEIAFFTGAYVVRAVATQMQIAWCLAHYYGHVTALGQRLLRTTQSNAPVRAAIGRTPRAKGVTGKVNATRHRAVAPVTGPVDVLRPSSGQLDLRPLAPTGSATGSGQGPAVQPPGSDPVATEPAPGKLAGATSAGASGADLPAAGPASGTLSEAAGAPGANAGDPAGASASPDASDLRVTTGAASGKLAAATSPGASGSGLAVATGPATMKLGGPASASSAPAIDVSGSRPATLRHAGIPNTPVPVSAASFASAASPVTFTSAASPASFTGASGPGNAIIPPDGGSSPTSSTSAADQTSTVSPSSVSTPAGPAGPGGPAGPATAGASGALPASLGGSGSTAAAPRAAVPVAGPSMPTLIPGVFASPDDDALPRPVLDEPSARMLSALDEGALPTPVLDDESSAPIHTSQLADEEVTERPRARSISGEIRVPVRRAPSIKPPMMSDDDDEPLIVIERSRHEDVTSRTLPPRRRAVKSDPPELHARAGEVDLEVSGDRAIDHAIDVDEPRIVIDEDALMPTGPTDVRGLAPAAAPITMIDVIDESDTGAVIHDRVVDRDAAPILLDRARPSQELPAEAAPGETPAASDEIDDADTGEIDIVVLDAPKKPRPERRTKLGVPPPGSPRSRRRGRAVEAIEDPTKVDLRAAPPREDATPSDHVAAPPAPASDADTNPHLVAPPPAPTAPRSAPAMRAVIVDEDDDSLPLGPRTSEMTAQELDEAIPERAGEQSSEQLLRRRIEYDPVDDGWGPPGTTIPPPLLGAIPGTEDDDHESGAIPMPNVDSSPLLVSPASLPSTGEPAGRSLARALEDATVRAIEVIRELERARSRDEVIDVMVSHLAESHHRAGFFATRHATARAPGELALFAVTPRPTVMPAATLRLDRPSTLQDVIGTRLPYRGPMHDEASRAFLIATLGACPAEILLVPVAVRERVVGVVFGEHRMRHTFDDQLALSARAAGMALERILRARRGG